MTPFDQGMTLVLAVVAAVMAIAGLIETHTWRVLVEDHARRIEALERGSKRERVVSVD